MDTRQLSAFVAVVELRSFSQAATRLGVTQPAVSLQIRSLEQRLGQRLVDRSGRRVEPTEAGERLYQSAKRMLQIEEELLAGLAESETGELSGALKLGASTGPGGAVVPVLLCAFQQANQGLTVSLDELRSEPLIVMQEGAGVRQVIDDELRGAGVRLRDLDVRIELGLQDSVRSAVRAGYGITFISRTAVEAELEAGELAEAHVQGLAPRRELALVRASGREPTRAAEAFVAFARERLA